MQLTSLKINGLHNPMGMAYAHLNISWLVEEAAEYCYTPDTDYRRLYSFETRLEQLRPDPRAMAILKEYAPTFYGEIAAGDVEKGNMQLGVIPHLHFIPQDPARTMEAIEKVCALLAE